MQNLLQRLAQASTSARRWTNLLFLAVLFLVTLPAYAQQLPISLDAALLTAITQHGGAAVRAVTRLKIEGQTSGANGTMPIVIQGDLAGSVRLDYGNPVTRSIINTPTGSTEIINGKVRRKPPHVGAFAQLDLLSIFGLLRLDGGRVTWTDLGLATVGGRATLGRRADTGQTKELLRRVIRDQTDIRFDVGTGLVSSITRTHYAENSLDFSMPVTFVFSDDRVVSSIVVPFRIDV